MPLPKKIITLLLFSVFFILKSEAQTWQPTYCVDTTIIQVNPACNPEFWPVCGCDSTTYRNECFALANGVLQYENGICETVALDFYPNPVIDFLNLTLVTRYETDVHFFISDVYGNIYYVQYFRNVDRLPLTLDVTNYDHGVYIIIAESRDDYVVKKFVKTERN